MARTKSWLYLLFFPIFVQAQTNKPPAAIYPANRYLLVVETSHSMLHRSEAMVQTVQDLLKSPLATQARRGDTLGVWVFNEDLYTGLLSLQQWTPETQKTVTEHVVGFLRAQKFEKKSRLDKVIPALNRVVRNSPFITVILVCVGDDEVHGTPFDDRINGFFQSWRQQQLDARTPFVIALRAQAGAFVDYSMNPAPWPAELPALPKELFVAIPVAQAPIPQPQPRKPATSSVPPLIISGRKRESSPSITNASPTSPAPALAGSGGTNLAPQPVPVSTTATPSEPSRTAAVVPLVQPATPASTSSSPPIAAAQAPPTPLRETPAQIPQPVTHPQSSEPGATDVPAPERISREPGNLPAMLAARAGTTAITAQTLVSSAPAPAQPKPEATQQVRPLVSDDRPPAVEVANIGAAKSHLHRIMLSLAGLVSLGTILAAIWIWKRRSRAPAGEVSLITESIDRRKP
jgi:hypothetical protein